MHAAVTMLDLFFIILCSCKLGNLVSYCPSVYFCDIMEKDWELVHWRMRSSAGEDEASCLLKLLLTAWALTNVSKALSFCVGYACIIISNPSTAPILYSPSYTSGGSGFGHGAWVNFLFGRY